MNIFKNVSILLIASLVAPYGALGAKKKNGRYIAEVAGYSQEELLIEVEKKTQEIERAKQALAEGKRIDDGGTILYKVSEIGTVASGIGAVGSFLTTVHHNSKVKKVLTPEALKSKTEKANKLKALRDGLDLESTEAMERIRGMEVSEEAKAKAWAKFFKRKVWKNKEKKVRELTREVQEMNKEFDALKKGQKVHRTITAGAMAAFLAFALSTYATKKDNEAPLTEEEYAEYQAGVMVMEIELAELKQALKE